MTAGPLNQPRGFDPLAYRHGGHSVGTENGLENRLAGFESSALRHSIERNL